MWNLANTGTSINSQMEGGPESKAADAINRGAELEYVTTIEFYNADKPPTRAELDLAEKNNKSTPEKKLRWLGSLVAKRFTVIIKVPKQPIAGAPFAVGRFPPFEEPGFLTGKNLQLLNGPAPEALEKRVLKKAIETMKPDRRVIPYKELAAALEPSVDPDVVNEALRGLTKTGGALTRIGRFFYVLPLSSPASGGVRDKVPEE
jgi:hypothetical protein